MPETVLNFAKSDPESGVWAFLRIFVIISLSDKEGCSMGEEKKRLPIGLENFEQLIKDNYYYIDKTKLISELIRNGGMVNLFTRPRRFGKTLNMSMLEYFFP